MRMEAQFEFGTPGALARVLAALQRLRNTMNNYIDERVAAVRSAWVAELRRTASAVIYALLTAFFVCSAAAWGAFALMLAFWDTHRVLVAGLLAGGFLLLGGLTVALLRSGTR